MFDVARARAEAESEEQAIAQMLTIVDLIVRQRAGVARARIVGVVWTRRVARVVQADARQRGLAVWPTWDGSDERATVSIFPLQDGHFSDLDGCSRQTQRSAKD
ncbi:MAG TPA: hypothetical protein VNL16_05080 [Chloroflexota bacterium]|nr:hypothetical protein [Chloroflexota bacterium]